MRLQKTSSIKSKKGKNHRIYVRMRLQIYSEKTTNIINSQKQQIVTLLLFSFFNSCKCQDEVAHVGKVSCFLTLTTFFLLFCCFLMVKNRLNKLNLVLYMNYFTTKIRLKVIVRKDVRIESLPLRKLEKTSIKKRRDCWILFFLEWKL